MGMSSSFRMISPGAFTEQTVNAAEFPKSLLSKGGNL